MQLPAFLHSTDYSLTAAWAFETWQGSSIAAQLSAIKQPYGYTSNAADDSDAAGAAHAWTGRLELRCSSHQCREAAAALAARLVAFITNEAFQLSSSSSSASSSSASDTACSTSLHVPGKVGLPPYRSAAEGRQSVMPLWSRLTAASTGGCAFLNTAADVAANA